MPAARSAGAAGTRSPSTSISPSPASASVMCASGARSPDAPTEPCDGMYGTRPALCAAISVSTTASRTPEWPRARLAALSASISRTTGGCSGSPTPTECERIRFICSVASWSASIRGAGELAEAGVDAVDRGVALGRALDDRGAGADRLRAPSAASVSSTPPAWIACRTSSVSLPGWISSGIRRRASAGRAPARGRSAIASS